MVLNSIYNWLFASDVLVFHIGDEDKKQVVLRVGDKVSVYSERFKAWFDDGIVTATFRDRVTVAYGLKKYFGWTFKRGNEKTILVSNIKTLLRPHKLQQIDVSGGLRLVAPAVKGRQLDSKTVRV